MHYRTYVTKPAEVERSWYVVDAEGQTVLRGVGVPELERSRKRDAGRGDVPCLQGDEVAALAPSNLEGSDDVRVLEQPRQLALPDEHLHEPGLFGELGPHAFDGRQRGPVSGCD